MTVSRGVLHLDVRHDLWRVFGVQCQGVKESVTRDENKETESSQSDALSTKFQQPLAKQSQTPYTGRLLTHTQLIMGVCRFQLFITGVPLLLQPLAARRVLTFRPRLRHLL